MTLIFKLVLIVMITTHLFSCDKADNSRDENQPNPTVKVNEPKPISDLTRDAWNHYHIYGVDSFSQPVVCMAELKKQITELIKNPSDEALGESREYVATCLSIYKATTIFIAANKTTQLALDKLRGRIATRLEMPGFIDAIEGYPFSGIVNDTSLPLTKNDLINQHGLTDPNDVSLGFYVLEFLLWGENTNPEKHIARMSNDFAPAIEWQKQDIEIGLNELDIKEHPNNRRRRYLELATLILEADLNQLATTWNKNTLPPLNQETSQVLKLKVFNLLKDSAAEIKTTDSELLETLLPLLLEENDNQSKPSSLSQWLGVQGHKALEDLTNQETPDSAKITALKSLFELPATN
ncbi:MAG: hypothetical protein MI867_18360 [Pseudomonadales bacterium]|nr:hypothetical protein [Pseudomonadales bacterium]